MMTLRGGVLRMTTPSSMVLSDLNTIPNNCIRENSLWLINWAALVRIRPGPYISAMHLFISFFVTDFVRKTSPKICCLVKGNRKLSDDTPCTTLRPMRENNLTQILYLRAWLYEVVCFCNDDISK